MSTQPQPPQIPLQDATLMCLGCQTILKTEVQRPKILNMETFSLIIFEHAMHLICPQCSAQLILVVNAVPGLGLAGKPMTKPLIQVPEKHIILPENN